LDHGEVVYVICVQRGDEVLWQATADYWFALAEGYLGPLPSSLQGDPINRGLSVLRSTPPTPAVFASWTQRHAVSAVIVDDRARAFAVRFVPLIQRSPRQHRGAGLQASASNQWAL